MTVKSSDPIGAFPNPEPLPGWTRVDGVTFERAVDGTRIVSGHGGDTRWAVRSGPILSRGGRTWLRKPKGFQVIIFFEAYIDAMRAAEKKWPAASTRKWSR